MNKIIPALPTLLVLLFLSYDFSAIVNRLYVSISLYYFVAIVFVFLLFVHLLTKYKDAFSLLPLSLLLLLIAGISFPIMSAPANFLIRNFTHWNRVLVSVDLEMQSENFYEFKIIAIGDGSKKSFIIYSGYTNVAIDQNYGHGPSLKYKLQPNITFTDGTGLTPEEYDIHNVFELYEMIGVSEIKTKPIISEFVNVLHAFQSTTSIDQFHSVLSNKKQKDISLIPYENVLHRTAFLLVSIGIVFLSIVLSSKSQGIAQQVAGRDR